MLDVAKKRVKWMIGMQEAANLKQPMAAHLKADAILQQIVEEAGFPEIVELYKKVERKYGGPGA